MKLASIALMALVSLGQAGGQAALARARDLYNSHQYDQAITAARDAARQAPLANSANVVLARACLERYRQSGSGDDLAVARETLKKIDERALAPREHVEFLVALGESLYFDQPDEGSLGQRYGAAAEMFEEALVHANLVGADGREDVFEWWATSLDHQAQTGPEGERRRIYERILARAERELADNDRSAVATYWLAAAARGTDDLQRAWGAAMAGWIRAPRFGARGTALRSDLDRLVTQVILPERARQLSPGGDPRPALALLEAQWEELKRRWSRERPA
jgi:hypothetical protein